MTIKARSSGGVSRSIGGFRAFPSDAVQTDAVLRDAARTDAVPDDAVPTGALRCGPVVGGAVVGGAARGRGRHRRTAAEPECALGHRILLVVGIVALAVNLRCAVTSLGAILGEVTRAWGSPACSPGWSPHFLARRLGPERLVAAAMLAPPRGRRCAH